MSAPTALPPAPASLPQRRIVFVINSLAGGGAERALINLLNFAGRSLANDEVHLVLLDREPEHHQVPAWVKRTTLDARYGLLRSTFLLYKTMARLKPTVTVSFLTRANCANIVVSKLLGRPFIISERVHTSSHFGNGWRSLGPRALVRWLYPKAERIVAVSRNVQRDLVETFKVPSSRISVIGNGISLDLIGERAALPPTLALPERFILAAGRLVPAKNFAMLIEAYRTSGLDCQLLILGEGPERPRLEALIAGLGLCGRVLLPGYVANPYPVIKRALFFVSSSNAEGFPNALVEAMALGCPVIATDCEAGPAEILDASHRATNAIVTASFGLLVPVNAPKPFAEAMHRMSEPTLRQRFARQSLLRAKDYAPEQVVASYMALLAAAWAAAPVVRTAGLELVQPDA